MADPIKSGYKTTEFWLSALAMVIGAVIASGVLDEVATDSWIAKLIGGIVAVLGSVGYTVSRAKVKSGMPPDG